MFRGLGRIFDVPASSSSSGASSAKWSFEEFHPIPDDVADLVTMDLLTLLQLLDAETNTRTRWQTLIEQGPTKALILEPNLKAGGLFKSGRLIAC